MSNHNITINDTTYTSIRVRVYDRVGHRTVKAYASAFSGLFPTWSMWQGLNVDGVRYTKTLLGVPAGATKEERICFIG